MPDKFQYIQEALGGLVGMVQGGSQGNVELYRLIIAIMVSIFVTMTGTLFSMDRFIPYPWPDDKPEILSRLGVLESQMRVVEELKDEVTQFRMENYHIHNLPTPKTKGGYGQQQNSTH